MDYIETIGVSAQVVKSKDDQLHVVPRNYRAQHCKTVEEYRLFLFSSNYRTSSGGNDDLYSELGIDIPDNNE